MFGSNCDLVLVRLQLNLSDSEAKTRRRRSIAVLEEYSSAAVATSLAGGQAESVLSPQSDSGVEMSSVYAQGKEDDGQEARTLLEGLCKHRDNKKVCVPRIGS